MVNKELTAGSYKEVWNGTDRLGNQLPSGIYLCRIAAFGLETGRNYTTSRKMVLLK